MDLQGPYWSTASPRSPHLEPLGPLGTDNDLLLFLLFILFLFLFYCNSNSLQTSQKTFKWKAASFILPLIAVPVFVSVYSGPGLVSDHILCCCSPEYLAGGSNSKEFACNSGDPGSIPGFGRSPGEGIGNLLQHPCLETFMDGGAWQATVLEITKSWTRATDFHFSLSVLSIQYVVDPHPLKCFDWASILYGNPVTHITKTNVSW